MKKKILFGFLAAVLVISLIVGWAPKAICAEKKIVWRLQTFSNIGDYPEPWLQFFADGVKKRTDGRMEVQIFHAGELGIKGPDYLRVLRDGLLECAMVPTPYVAGDFPIFELTNLPFLIGNQDEMASVIHKIMPIIAKKLAKEWKVEALVPVPVFPQTLQSTKPINSMDDLKGLKIRTSAVGQALLWKAAGACPLAMPMAECYTSLQRHVIDAVNIALSLHLTMKLYEICKYVYTIDVNSPAMLIAASKKSYDSLAPDLQQAVKDAADATFPVIVAGGKKILNDDIVKLREKGCTVQAFNPELEAELRALAPPIWEAWAKRLSPKIPEAKQLLDIIREALHK